MARFVARLPWRAVFGHALKTPEKAGGGGFGDDELGVFPPAGRPVAVPIEGCKGKASRGILSEEAADRG